MDWQIFGHDWAVNLLRAHAAEGKLRHAYLLVGPEGVGRQTLALRFAQSLNCSAPPEKGGFCNACRDCRQIWSLAHPDMSLLVPGEGHKDVLIDQVRELQHTLALAPYASPYRIALLPDFQRTTTQAANALLKTLEEPPGKVVLLLTANALECLLPTIVSRCEVIRLRPASIHATQHYLHSVKGLTGETSRFLAHLSSGRVGAAIQLADDQDALTRRHEHLGSLLRLLSARYYERFKLAEDLARPYDKARQKMSEVLPIWLSYWRDVFIVTSGAELPLVNVDLELQVGQTASKLDAKTARALVIAHEQAIQQMDAYVNVRLLIETLMLKWPRLTTSVVSLQGMTE